MNGKLDSTFDAQPQPIPPELMPEIKNHALDANGHQLCNKITNTLEPLCVEDSQKVTLRMK